VLGDAVVAAQDVGIDTAQVVADLEAAQRSLDRLRAATHERRFSQVASEPGYIEEKSS
jgi:hypothetical protein